MDELDVVAPPRSYLDFTLAPLLIGLISARTAHRHTFFTLISSTSLTLLLSLSAPASAYVPDLRPDRSPLPSFPRTLLPFPSASKVIKSPSSLRQGSLPLPLVPLVVSRSSCGRRRHQADLLRSLISLSLLVPLLLPVAAFPRFRPPCPPLPNPKSQPQVLLLPPRPTLLSNLLPKYLPSLPPSPETTRLPRLTVALRSRRTSPPPLSL